MQLPFNGCRQYPAGASVEIDQPCRGRCGADQRLSGMFYRKVQTAAPGNGIVLKFEPIALEISRFSYVASAHRTMIFLIL